MSNIITYSKKGTIEYYLNAQDLQLPEKTILKIYSSELSSMKMLDIGVGGGRTTLHFSNLTKEYLGIDYSKEMISACKERFFESVKKNIDFETVDVRDMSSIKSQEFDFILFSFNGIDYISHDDRLQAFKEIHRVGRPGGIFCFSTHNLNYARRIFSVRSLVTAKPTQLLKRFRAYKNLWRHNKAGLKIVNDSGVLYSIFLDGAFDFSLSTYHIDPSSQFHQLQNTGLFENIKMYSLITGREVSYESNNKNTLFDPWIYYTCNFV